MEDFFNTIYYYTNGFYDVLLDTYLYQTIPGYLHVGLFNICVSFAICMVFYYLFAPVRRQTIWWFIYALINGVVNLGISLYYTITPLINNEIEPDAAWSELDCIGFGITNILWSFVFFVVFSLIVKWWSTAKYVPFQKF